MPRKNTVYSSLVDFYSKYPEKAIRIITPKMPKANYTLQVEITGVRPVWTDKTKTIYGSDGTFVTIDNVYHFLSYSISYAKGLRYRMNHAKDRRNVTLEN